MEKKREIDILNPMPVFFGEKGITCKSADFLANLAQSFLTEQTVKLENMKLLNKKASLLDSEVVKTIVKGVSNDDFDKIIKDYTEKAAMMNAFTAWVREAIKCKEELQKVLDEYDKNYWYEFTYGVPYPTKGEIFTKIWHYDAGVEKEQTPKDLGVKDCARYLALEAMASVYGKLIHKGGILTAQREEMHKACAMPTEMSATPCDKHICFEQEPSVDTEHVDEVYNELQRRYRQYEAELNKMKNDLERANKEIDMRNQQRRSATLLEKTDEQRVADLEFFAWKKAQLDKVDNLKIVIPNALVDTYNFLQELGKTSK